MAEINEYATARKVNAPRPPLQGWQKRQEQIVSGFFASIGWAPMALVIGFILFFSIRAIVTSDLRSASDDFRQQLADAMPKQPPPAVQTARPKASADTVSQEPKQGRTVVEAPPITDINQCLSVKFEKKEGTVFKFTVTNLCSDVIDDIGLDFLAGDQVKIVVGQWSFAQLASGKSSGGEVDLGDSAGFGVNPEYKITGGRIVTIPGHPTRLNKQPGAEK